MFQSTPLIAAKLSGTATMFQRGSREAYARVHFAIAQEVGKRPIMVAKPISDNPDDVAAFNRFSEVFETIIRNTQAYRDMLVTCDLKGSIAFLNDPNDPTSQEIRNVYVREWGVRRSEDSGYVGLGATEVPNLTGTKAIYARNLITNSIGLLLYDGSNAERLHVPNQNSIELSAFVTNADLGGDETSLDEALTLFE